MSALPFITSVGFISSTAFAGCNRFGITLIDPDLPMPWSDCFLSPYPRFDRLDPLSQYIAAATDLADPTMIQAELRSEMGVFLGTNFGSCGADSQFWRSVQTEGIGSPKFFPYTLPSIGIGELTIRHGIGGPSYCFMKPSVSGITALQEADYYLRQNQIQACLCIAADSTREFCETPSYACALIIQNLPPLASGSSLPLADFLAHTEGKTDVQVFLEKTTFQPFFSN